MISSLVSATACPLENTGVSKIYRDYIKITTANPPNNIQHFLRASSVLHGLHALIYRALITIVCIKFKCLYPHFLY